MKKIINHKMYDTKTATIIAIYDNGLLPGDEYQYYEELYRKHTNEFFLFGIGGVYTKYGKYPDLCTITPLTYKQAQDWLGDRGDVDSYINIFGKPEE